MPDLPPPCTAADLAAMTSDYHRRWGLGVACFDCEGHFLAGDDKLLSEPTAAMTHLLGESLRWGEATICVCQAGWMHWAAPIMVNDRCTGALVSGVAEARVFPKAGAGAAMDCRAASRDLRLLLEERHCTNGHLLAERRRLYRAEQEKAYLLHEAKTLPGAPRCQSVQELYLREEPALLSAIRQGEPERARQMLNRVLMVIYQGWEQDLELVKTMVLELVVAMTRAAVEAGGAAEDLLGVRFAGLTTLGAIDSHEDLAAWVSATLNRVMASIASQSQTGDAEAIEALRGHLKRHLAEPLRREDLARHLELSPARMSRLVRQHTGHSWTDELARIRIDHACDLLRRGATSLTDVALDCGFADQSHFTRTFRKLTGRTPGEFRKALA